MKAYLKNYRQSPRKVRLIANLIKGKSVAAADAELAFLVKRGALPFRKLLDSAVANARTNSGIEKENLIVKEVRVDKGVVLKRSMPRAFGRASQILKRSSHIMLSLSEKPAAEISKSKKTEKKTITPKKVKAKATS